MEKILKVIAIGFTLAGGLVSNVSASTVVFDNGSAIPSSGRACSNYICANDFVFLENTTITGAALQGATQSLAADQAILGNAGAMSYFIYTDDGSGPGSVVEDGVGQNKILELLTTVDFDFGPDSATLSFDFDNSFTALANTKYWFGYVSNLISFNIGDSGINLSTGQQCLISDSCPASFYETSDFNFQLIGGPEVSTVPVPAALPLFGAGLALMGFIRWRKKRKVA